MKALSEIESRIGYTFNDKSLLRLALTHSSYGNEVHHDRLMNNERLEFLGDAVLELTVSEMIFEKYPDLPEGELSKLRSSLVCEKALAISANDINLSEALLLGKGENITGGRFRDSITSDAMEALLGAIYRDGGIECARDFVLNHIVNDMERKRQFVDSKSILQEMIQAVTKEPLEYELIGESGPDHCKEFTVRAKLGGRTIGEGSGRNKKSAEQQAAYNAISKIKANGLKK